MKKIIAAFDGLDFNLATLDYAAYLTKESQAHLVGVFLEDMVRHSYSVVDITHFEGGDFDKHLQELNQKDKEEQKESIGKFEEYCHRESISYSIHRDRNVAAQELLKESIYADLLVINRNETMTRYEEAPPARFVKDILHDVQCPVLVVPERFQPFDKIIFLFDGAPSSVYAMRMFSYLFTPFRNLDIEILTVNTTDENLHIPDNRLIKEFIKHYYSKAEYQILRGFPQDEIIRHLHHEKGVPLIVSGAYRRSRLSRMFRTSLADHIMRQTDFPLFIAHSTL